MSRVAKVRQGLREKNVDGILITSLYNRRYISGFTGTAGVVLITEREAVFITDFRYMEQATSQVQGLEIVIHEGTIFEEVAKKVKDMKITRLGFESAHLTYQQFEIYKKQIPSTTEMVPVNDLIEKLRIKKDEAEIKIIQEAADIADAAFSHIINFIKPGLKEIEVANELEFFMRREGATSSSFDIIVASGVRSALPHGVASHKIIKKGELVTLDFGAYYKGYCSDITRTVAVGNINSELKDIYDTVFEAQRRGMEGLKPGMTGKQADALTRDYIEGEGYGEYFGHSTGHGLGMEVHEAPTLSKKSEIMLEPGMIVTVEPGIYIAGVGGCRIEDDTLITENGNRSFTKSPKELLYVGE